MTVMSVAVLLHDAESAKSLLPWVSCLVEAGKGVIVLRPSGGTQATAEVSLKGDDDVARAVSVVARELDLSLDAPEEADGDDAEPRPQSEHDAPARARLFDVPASVVEPVLEILAAESVELFVIPRPERKKGDDPRNVFERQLFLRAPCNTMMLRMSEGGATPRRILVPTAGGPHSRTALRMAAALAEAQDGEVTALFVEPKIGSEAEVVGRRILDKIVRSAVPAQHEKIRRKVVVGDDPFEGIATATDVNVDLVLCGTSYLGSVKRLLHGTLSDKILGRDGPSVAVVRRAIPLASRLRQTIDRWLQAAVPQLDREGRLSLVEKVQSNSQFDFDFVALLSLSTLIAALGLVQSSAAVVIGAMLVAPLMTPLVGTGLALAQGNLRLIRNAMRSVVLGFCCAFILGLLTGIGVPDVVATPEMLARGSPTILDLIVASLSGVAAAYASSRPHLSSALPGVAIAAALVPPIATSGIALSVRRPGVAAGAALLFVTNMVAIILGSAACLWAVGFRAGHQHGRVQRWVPSGMVIALMLFGLTAWALDDDVDVPADFAGHVRELVRAERCRLVELDATRVPGGVRVRLLVEGPGVPSDAFLESVERTAGAEFQGEVTVRLESRIVKESR